MAPKKETVLKLTSFRYKKPGISDEDFHMYASKDHAPKAALIQARHGALKVAQYHTPQVVKDLILTKIPWVLHGPGWKLDDHDIMISIWVRTTDQMTAIVMDPDFQSLVAGEDEISDQEKATVTAGWEEVYVENGQVVDVDYGTWEERSSAGSGSTATAAPKGDIRI